MNYLILSMVSILSASGGAWITVRGGRQFGLVDYPNERSSHYRPTPKGGAVGIAVAFVLVSISIGIPLTFWLPAALLGFLSFWGDKFDLSPKVRLPVQFLAALVVLGGVFQIGVLRTSTWFLVLPLAIYIVGTSNFYNFMDGINGISAISGLVAFGLLAFTVAFSRGDMPFIMLATSIALSCLGFLPFNVPKAKVFMGDVGSILLGFVFAGIVVLNSKDVLDFVCLTSFLFPFYADELATMAVRLRDRENLLRPHRRHAYQLLANELKFPHWKVSLGYGVFQLVVALSVLAVKRFGLTAVIFVLVAYFVAFLFFSRQIRRKAGDVAQQTLQTI